MQLTMPGPIPDAMTITKQHKKVQKANLKLIVLFSGLMFSGLLYGKNIIVKVPLKVKTDVWYNVRLALVGDKAVMAVRQAGGAENVSSVSLPMPLKGPRLPYGHMEVKFGGAESFFYGYIRHFTRNYYLHDLSSQDRKKYVTTEKRVGIVSHRSPLAYYNGKNRFQKIKCSYPYNIDAINSIDVEFEFDGKTGHHPLLLLFSPTKENNGWAVFLRQGTLRFCMSFFSYTSC